MYPAISDCRVFPFKKPLGMTESGRWLVGADAPGGPRKLTVLCHSGHSEESLRAANKKPAPPIKPE